MAERTEYLGITVPPLPESLIPIVLQDPAILPKSQDYTHLGLKRELQKLIAGLTGTEDGKIQLSDPPQEIPADYALACHPLARSLRKSPVAIAHSIADQVKSGLRPELVEDVYALNGYLNFVVNANLFGSRVLQEVKKGQDSYGRQDIGEGAKVVIDCSSPNVAKYMSVGHLRSTIIGESLSRIHRAIGYTVVRDNHLGDWGTQFGMLTRAHELWGQDYAELRNDTNPVQGLYKLYVRIHEEVEKEKEAESAKLGIPKDDIETSLEKEGKRWFQRLESGDDEALKLLRWATERSLKEFQRVYDLLGTKYEYMLGESFYVSMLPNILQFLRNRGIAEYDAEGVLAVNLQAQRLSRLVVQKSDGTSLYATRDLATLVARTAWFDPQKILYVVGGDQREYFQQVFAAFERMTEGEKRPKTEHISFGMITLPEGKMSSRAGRVIFLEDVLDEAISRARIKADHVITKDILTDLEKDEIARKIGVGAVIFFDLGQGRDRKIEFDWDKALSFEGYSAPYIQYAHARTAALLRRADELNIELDQNLPPVFDHPTEAALVKQLSRFPEAVAKAGILYKPDIIAQYVYTIATMFNDLYKQARIVNEGNPGLRNTRLRLTQATAQVIRNGLNLLCIEAPERM